MKTINKEKLAIAAQLVRAVSSHDRMKIIERIDQERSVEVGEIYKKLGFEQSWTSLQLKVLRQSDIAKPIKVGTNVFYSLNYDAIERIVNIAKAI